MLNSSTFCSVNCLQYSCCIFQFSLYYGYILSSSVDKESACNAGDPSSIPGSGRSPGEGIEYPLQYSWASLVAQLVKNPLVMWETWVQSLGWEDPLGRERLPTPVFWPGEFHGLCIVQGVAKSRTQLRNFHFLLLPPLG